LYSISPARFNIQGRRKQKNKNRQYAELENIKTDQSRNLGIKAKVENKTQYEQYLQELEPIREELGIDLKEVLYPDLPMAA
jgi:hypothetical protein